MRYGRPTLRDSFFGWLGVAAPATVTDTRVRVLEIRHRMLGELLEGSSAGASVLARQIRHATDAQALWYCRSELMLALSRRRGESAAKAAVLELTPLFDGLVPVGLIAVRPETRRR